LVNLAKSMIKKIIFPIIISVSISYSQQQFTSEKYGFNITFPSGWDVEKETASLVAVIARLNSNTSINIIVQDQDPSNEYIIAQIDVDKFKEDLENKYKEHFKSYKTVDYGRATVNLYNALYMTYICDFNSNIIRTKQYFLFRNNKIYIISTGCLESEHENFYSIYNDCLNSFTFN